MRYADYDDYGNIIEERNALGRKTRYGFTGPLRLFEGTVRNPKNHKTETTWDYGCQKPSEVTDPNGLVTTFTYDVHCRETRKQVSWGQTQDYRTRYVSFGDASAQYVEKYHKSSSSESGQRWQYSRQYFDGMGRVYKETQSGAVSSIDASSVTVRRFDQRGKVAWESIPISWADAFDNVANSNQRVTYTYDPDDLSLRKIAAENGLEVNNIYKTLMTKGDKTGIVIAVVSGENALSLKKLSK